MNALRSPWDTESNTLATLVCSVMFTSCSTTHTSLTPGGREPMYHLGPATDFHLNGHLLILDLLHQLICFEIDAFISKRACVKGVISSFEKAQQIRLFPGIHARRYGPLFLVSGLLSQSGIMGALRPGLSFLPLVKLGAMGMTAEDDPRVR